MPKLRTPAGKTVSATTAGAAALLDRGYTYANEPSPEAATPPPTELTLAERIEAVTSHDDANTLAAELGVEGFKEKAPKVNEKKQALRDAAAAKVAAEPAAADGLDDLSDEELAAKVVEQFPDEDPEKVATAIAERRAQVIAGLRQS